MRPATILASALLVFAAAASADNWAVSVPKGKLDADRLAEEHGLRNSGEVVPGSNIYHFKVPKDADNRRKRAAAADVKTLSEHPDVDFLEEQTERLKRYKRAPVPDQDDTGTEVCFIHTKATKERDSKRCVFPFNYKGKGYLRCTTDQSVNDEEWCATEVDSDGDVVTGQWGDCDNNAIRCFKINADGAQSDSSPPPPRRPPTSESRGPPPQRRPPPQRQGLPPQSRPRLNPFLQNGGGGVDSRFGGPPPQFRGQDPQFRGQDPQFRGQDPQFRGQQPQFRGQQQPRRPPGPPPPRFRPQQGQGRFGGDGQRPPQLPLRGEPRFPFGQLPGGGRPQVNLVDNEVDETPVDLSSFKTYMTDKAWPKMWFLNRGGDLDMNVEDAWEQGYTGKGVKVTILDDGIEYTHEDLKANFDQDASIDLNDDDPDPFPRYDFFNSNKHGTRCAGTVAASANNSECGVGIAPNAGIGGVRILDGHILDVLEAQALSFNRSYIDIYSASWGPDDNGKTVDGPGTYASQALRDGVLKGRNGKGSIFVWASGNGGKYLDNCNADGYATSIYTLSVSSASENGLIPWYSEQCSSSIATTYSSGSKRFKERKVVTTDLHGECTDQHTGTSASSPMAAGIVALALEANPDLDWRDVQHITVRTSRPKGNLKAEDWADNGVGRQFSHAFGFGLMDAGAMTRMAKDWKNVPKQISCNSPKALEEPLMIGAQEEKAVMLDATSCEDVNFLEQVHLHIDLKTTARRGDLSVMLRSPSQTVSILLAPRPFDDIRTGLDLFEKWPMMSVHFWSEPVVKDGDGKWFLFIKNDGDKPAKLNNFDVTFYGTNKDPQPGVPNLIERLESSKKPEVTTHRPRGSFTSDFAHRPRKTTPTFSKEFAHPQPKAVIPEGGGYAEGYGPVSPDELAALLEADSDFQFRTKLNPDELNAPKVDMAEDRIDVVYDDEEEEDDFRAALSAVAILNAALAETEVAQVEEIQPKTLSVDVMLDPEEVSAKAE